MMFDHVIVREPFDLEMIFNLNTFKIMPWTLCYFIGADELLILLTIYIILLLSEFLVSFEVFDSIEIDWLETL